MVSGDATGRRPGETPVAVFVSGEPGCHFERELSRLVADATPPARFVVGAIVKQMTALAPGKQIFVPAILGRVVQVHGREDNRRPGFGVGAAVEGSTSAALMFPTASAVALATAFGALKPNAEAYRFPVLRVSSAVLGGDRH